METTPFIDVWNALWIMVERNDRLTHYVRPGNRIKFTNTIGPKKEISEGDLPELQLHSSGADINIVASSSSSKVTRRYSWGITTGEYDINKYYNLVSWELYRSMIDWDIVLCALVWPKESEWHYVTNVQISTVDEGTAMIDENRGIIGWSAMMQIDVEMHFNVDALRI
jgi:hypothetical protein